MGKAQTNKKAVKREKKKRGKLIAENNRKQYFKKKFNIKVREK